MKEVKIYALLLAVLMVVAYLTWTREDEADTTGAVTIMSAEPANVGRIQLFTKTVTVALSFREMGGERFGWFTVENSRRERSFAGNEKTSELVEKFAPFEALRTLGKGLGKDELKQAGLDVPERRLVISARGKDRAYDVGGRTSGARDHYVRPEGSSEVFLVASKTLSDLQFPDGKYMQRKLRDADAKDVAKVTLRAEGRTKTVLHENRLSPREDFWAKEETPGEKNETLGNYVDKLDKLTAVEYLEDESAFEEATPVLEAVWYDENDEELGRMALRKRGEGKKADYYARSPDTHLPVKVSRFTAQQLEQDLAAVLEE